MHDDAPTVTAQATARLAEARTARFVAWRSAGEKAPGEDDFWASGTTDFVSMETRARQRLIPPSQMRQLKITREPNPLWKAAITAITWAVGHYPGAVDFQDLYYTDGRCWERAAADNWRPWHPKRQLTPDARAALDPTLVLEAIPVLKVIDARHPIGLHGVATELVEGRADLSSVQDRFENFLDAGLNRKNARGWYERAPIKLWIDSTGLVRRVSYLPPPPDARDPCWWTTLELSDYGTPVERPSFFEDASRIAEALQTGNEPGSPADP